MIDNSSVFRMEPDVPLVIPEINGEDVRQHSGLIANPNCTTAVALMALYPLHRAFGVRRVFAASYQAVSGSGARAISELRSQVEAAAEKQLRWRKSIRIRSRSTFCRTSIPFCRAATRKKK